MAIGVGIQICDLVMLRCERSEPRSTHRSDVILRGSLALAPQDDDVNQYDRNLADHPALSRTNTIAPCGSDP